VTKSELIEIMAKKHSHYTLADVKSAVDVILDHKVQTLASGEHIEIRGFGSFNIRYWTPCTSKNPKTGEAVSVPAKYKTRFRPGKELRERVNLKA